jgi:hypothetical protein
VNLPNDKRPSGFHLLAIDRFMRSSHAVPILALIAAASIIALLLTESGINGTWADFQHVVLTRWRFFALFAVTFTVGGWWTARTWRQLWRAGRSSWERLVYDYGVRGFGFSTAVALTAIITRLGWATDSAGLFGPMMTVGLLAGLFFGTPLALHLGYFWGTTFAAMTGIEHDHRSELGEPPHLAQLRGSVADGYH